MPRLVVSPWQTIGENYRVFLDQSMQLKEENVFLQ
jgi:hypothetical protein